MSCPPFGARVPPQPRPGPAHTVLALAPDGSDDGMVGPGDLAALRLDADLVVLSGCRTAGGVLVEGEGVQGLTAPLIQAGARSVVASQWRIADRRTIPFIHAFYQALAKGLPVGDALRAAKLDGLRRGAPPWEWAAFTAVGDPMVTVALRAPWLDAWRSDDAGGNACARRGGFRLLAKAAMSQAAFAFRDFTISMLTGVA